MNFDSNLVSKFYCIKSLNIKVAPSLPFLYSLTLT